MRVTVPLNVSLDVGSPTSAQASGTERRDLFEAAVVGPLMVWCGAKVGGFGGGALALIGIVRVVRSARRYMQGSSATLPVAAGYARCPGAASY